MLSLGRLVRFNNYSQLNRVASVFSKQIHVSNSLNIKEIVVKKNEEKKVTTIEGIYVPSPREGLLVETGHEKDGVCVLCALDLNLKHTDVLILSQFLRSDGCILPRKVTGLCKKQQTIIVHLVAMAQKAGLMPNLAPVTSKKDPLRRYGAKKLHRYFDEFTIPKYYSKYGYRPYVMNPKFGKTKEHAYVPDFFPYANYLQKKKHKK